MERNDSGMVTMFHFAPF